MKFSRKVWCGLFGMAITVLFAGVNASAKNGPQGFPQNATFTTLSLFPWQTEGLTGDKQGYLYTAARNVVDGSNAPQPCPVYRVSLDNPSPVVVGFIPLPAPGVACVASGLALDDTGELFIASSGVVYSLIPNDASPPTAIPYVTGVSGANGIAFDRNGNLWISQGFVNIANGMKGDGRIWMVAAGTPGPTGAIEKFRVQPMRTEPITIAGVLFDGIGRQVRSFPPGILTNTATVPGDVIVANGIAFNHAGELLIADTARGAIWKIHLDGKGNLLSETNCDKAFSSNTLCLSNILVAHPLLEATDGIALDMAGNIWGTANGRQAIVVVTQDGSVQEIFRNPLNAAGLRNEADPSYGNDHILEFPSSPFLLGDRFCTASFDAAGLSSRDNYPSTAGEISPNGPNRGKISCMDQDLIIPGLPLPL